MTIVKDMTPVVVVMDILLHLVSIDVVQMDNIVLEMLKNIKTCILIKEEQVEGMVVIWGIMMMGIVMTCEALLLIWIWVAKEI